MSENGETTKLRKILENDGRKVTWLSERTGIEYYKLDRIVNQGQTLNAGDAKKIARALSLTTSDLFAKSETLYEHIY